jgi:SAM-dependent methyltransferase
MNKGREHWLAVAGSASADDLREHILTGFKSGKPFTPYRPTIALPAPVGTVLDFGCGVGRSFPFLRTIAGRVTGFDLPPMIERCRALAADPADELADDWNALRTRRFDLVFTTLVLQHIEPALCRAYLEDFASMSPFVYLLTRATSDFDASVFRLVADTGLFEPGPCVEVDHDSETHQLRVLGHASVDDVMRSDAAGHYEVLLRSTIHGGRP